MTVLYILVRISQTFSFSLLSSQRLTYKKPLRKFFNGFSFLPDNKTDPKVFVYLLYQQGLQCQFLWTSSKIIGTA